MRSRQTYAIAASVAVAAIALPLTLHVLKQPSERSASSKMIAAAPQPPTVLPATAVQPAQPQPAKPQPAKPALPQAEATRAAIAMQERHRQERADGRETALHQVEQQQIDGPIGRLKKAAPVKSAQAIPEAADKAEPAARAETKTVQTVPVGRDGSPVGRQAALEAPRGVPGLAVGNVAPPSPPTAAAAASTKPAAKAVAAAPAAVAAPSAAPAARAGSVTADELKLKSGRLQQQQTVLFGTDQIDLRRSMAPDAAHTWQGLPDQPAAQPEQGRDRYAAAEPAPFKSAASEPVSTFSADVDTASYALVRRALNSGRLPPRESVRVEEMLNYFPYAYPAPESASQPFQPTITVVPAPWNPENRLMHVAIKGYQLNAAERPRANLVLLIDISGSMAPVDRLPLLKSGFRMLVENLKADDTVAIVTYASNTRIALEPTKVSDKGRILAVIDSLAAGGGTYGEGGLQLAYRLAEAHFDKAAVNRVILATDGDFNIGIADHGQLKTFIEGKRQTGIFLSVLGVGMGNHNDLMMQALAQNGNGVAAYIDTLSEARKVLIEEASSSLFPIAKDVKIQIEFNPAKVSEYRLIGYETRALRREDFNNDAVDAGDVGSGHAVTAIYEIVPVGAKSRTVDGLRYKPATAAAGSSTDPLRREPTATSPRDGEWAFFRLRYKLPAEDTSTLIEVPVSVANERRTLVEAPLDVRFAVAVATFGQLLQGSPHVGAPGTAFGWDEVIAVAQAARGDDPFGYRAEMITLMRLAKALPR